jgi:hypothetical protein
VFEARYARRYLLSRATSIVSGALDLDLDLCDGVGESGGDNDIKSLVRDTLAVDVDKSEDGGGRSMTSLK